MRLIFENFKKYNKFFLLPWWLADDQEASTEPRGCEKKPAAKEGGPCVVIHCIYVFAI